MPAIAMEPIRLRLDAPFAACRPFVAGWYRPTASFLTHSAIYGLLLNVAGIESRLWEHEPEHGGRVPASLTRNGLPAMRLALGLPEGAQPPRIESIYQQLHNYPVGTNGMPQELSKGTKNNITPVRREILCNVQAIVVAECNPDLLQSLRRGLIGEPTSRQYGLPFMGDNAFLLDRLEETQPQPVRWYERVDPDLPPQPGATRLTTYVDRVTMSNTRSDLFAPGIPQTDPPPAAWAEINPTS